MGNLKKLNMGDTLFGPELIKSVSFSQSEILKGIIQLYCKEGIECDVTYNQGGFYKDIAEPSYKLDLNPLNNKIIKADFTNLPFENNSRKNIVCNPPFVASWRKDSYATKVETRYTTVKGIKNLMDLYIRGIKEFHRVLIPGGILIFKCQDTVYANKNYFMSVLVHNEAVTAGFTPLDLFIKIVKSKFNFKQSQITARKYHSYFWVFKK